MRPASRSSTTCRTSPTTPEFTDHYLVDWHLTRIDSVGLGAGARFRVKAPGNRFSWGDVTFVEVDAPASDRRGRSHRQEQPHSHARRLRARVRRRPAPRACGSRWRPSPPRSPIACWRGSAARGWMQAQEHPGDAPAALDHRVRGAANAAARRVTGRRPDRLPRRMSSRLRKPHASSRLLALRRGARARRLRGLRTRGSPPAPTPASPGQNAPYLNVGPLVYEVQLSRELNPANIEDAAYLQGPHARSSARSHPAQEWFAVFMQVYNHSSTHLPAATRPDDQRHPEQRLHPDRAGRRPTNSPTAAVSSPPKSQLPVPELDRRHRAPPRARCCSTRSRSSRSTTVRWR